MLTEEEVDSFHREHQGSLVRIRGAKSFGADSGACQQQQSLVSVLRGPAPWNFYAALGAELRAAGAPSRRRRCAAAHVHWKQGCHARPTRANRQ